MAPPVVMQSPAFQLLSSPLGNSGATFDKGLDARDRIVYNWVERNNPPSPLLTWIPEVKAMYAAVFPGHGDFGPGGGPLL